jgi:hypothetical protein
MRRQWLPMHHRHRQGLILVGRETQKHRSSVFGSLQQNTVARCNGTVLCGLVWFGLVWFGKVWLGLAGSTSPTALLYFPLCYPDNSLCLKAAPARSLLLWIVFAGFSGSILCFVMLWGKSQSAQQPLAEIPHYSSPPTHSLNPFPCP